ncbi:MAG: hypothetical protein IJS46_04390, partial [Kiritimatiellae bacterium]|nr:hypothetical protein [Kiritimatiellia bacterium]
FGIDLTAELARRDPSDPFPVIEVAAGAGKVAVLLKPWSAGWEPGRPEPERRKALETLTRLGAFEPNVSSSHPCVFATPYRAADGSILVSVINITCLDREVEIGLSRALAGDEAPMALDTASGREIDAVWRDGRWFVRVNVGALDTTVLKVARAVSRTMEK